MPSSRVQAEGRDPAKFEAISSPGVQDGLEIRFPYKLFSHQQLYLGGEIGFVAAFFEEWTRLFTVPLTGFLGVLRLMECEHLARYFKDKECEHLARYFKDKECEHLARYFKDMECEHLARTP